MPYPNEHAVRINEPGKYEALRRENNKFGQGIDVIFGILSEGYSEIQAIRFRADKFTAEQARKWISDRKEFADHVKKFEPATRKDSDTISVNRFDRSTSTKVRRTDEGFMYVDTAVTRTGVFNYRLPDGSVRKELRHPDDIFTSDSLDTLKLKPVTNNHPEALLDSATARQHQIGTTGENVRHDVRYVHATMAITDKETVDAIEQGKRELSCGYRCELVPESGTFDGMDYDFRQTNVRYNHVAVVDRGRAGADVAISLDHMDGTDAEQIENSDTDNKTGKQPSQRRKSMPMIKLDGIDVEVDQNVANHVAKLDTTITESKKTLDTVTAERDTVKAKLDEQQKRLDKLPTEIATAVKNRLDLERKAMTVLAADTKLDGMSDKEIRLAVIKAKAPEAKMDDKSDEYIQARFDSTLELVSEDAIAKQRQQSTQRQDSNADACDSEKSRKDMIERMKNSYKPATK